MAGELESGQMGLFKKAGLKMTWRMALPDSFMRTAIAMRAHGSTTRLRGKEFTPTLTALSIEAPLARTS